MVLLMKLHTRVVVAILIWMSQPISALFGERTDGAVTIRSDFPGGNVAVVKNEGSSAHVEPDLRGDKPWFYWCFEAKALKAGRVRFVAQKSKGVGANLPPLVFLRGESGNYGMGYPLRALSECRMEVHGQIAGKCRPRNRSES